MIYYLHLVAPLPVMWSVAKIHCPVCECPIFRGEEDETLLVFFLSVMNQNWAETLSDIVD